MFNKSKSYIKVRNMSKSRIVCFARRGISFCMDSFSLLLLLSLAAGVVGTGLGGALGVLFADKGDKVTARVLAFAGGVMLGTAAFEMLPEAIECFGLGDRRDALAAIGALLGGAAIICGLSKFVEYLGKRQSAGTSGLVCILAEGADKKRMLGAGIIMLVAIALHNFPEGMAIGGAGSHELGLGVTVAIVIAVHNVPEGMAIAAPLAGGGMKAGRTILLTCLAGSATAAGALVGLAVGGLGGVATGICLGAAAGAMMYVTFADIFGEACALAGKLPSAEIFAGTLVAACFVYLA